jgi:hypothetical protein
MNDVNAMARAILGAGAVPPPPAGPLEPGVAYSLAFDIDGDFAAVSFAIPDMYPEVAAGMWCLAVVYTRMEGAWAEYGEHDNTTTPRPFERPARPENSVESWLDWHSNGLGGDVHSFFGVAPHATARLTVTADAGEERELRITPSNGAYVAVVRGESSTLTGYAADGRRLGAITTR